MLLSFLCLLFATVLPAQKILTATDNGSKVHFTIRNFGFKTGGDLTGLQAKVRFDLDNIKNWDIDASVDAASIDTDNNTRDGHLRGEDYFDVKKFPRIRMKSTSIETTGEAGVYKFNGELTIKGTSKPVRFPFRVNTSGEGYLFTGSFEMNRRDFSVGSSSISLADNLVVTLSIFAK